MTEPDHLHCIGCGYDLTGSTIGGRCPECALPVQRSVRQGEGKGTRNANATAALTMGVLSLVLAMPLGFFAVYYFTRAHTDFRNGNCSRFAFRWAVVGLVLGILGVFMLVLLIVAIGMSPGMRPGAFQTLPVSPF